MELIWLFEVHEVKTDNTNDLKYRFSLKIEPM